MLVQTFGYGANLYGYLICPDTEQIVALLNKAPNYKKTILEKLAVASESELLAMDRYDVLDMIDPDNSDNFALATMLANVINEAEGTSLIATWDVVNSDALLLVQEYTECTWGEYLGCKRMDYVSLEEKLDDVLFRYLKMLCKNIMCVFELWHWTKEVPDVPQQPQTAAEGAKKAFYVETPIGKIRVEAKGQGAAEGFPGVYIDFVKETGELIQLACTEYDPNEGTLCTEVFPGGEGAVTRFAHDGLPCPHIANDDTTDPLEVAKAYIQRFMQIEYQEDAVFDDLENVSLASAEVGDERFPIILHVVADLKNARLKSFLSPPGVGERVLVESMQYPTLERMNDILLSDMSFEGLKDIDDDCWAKFSESRIGRQWLRETFPEGTRVRLEYMSDVQAPPEGTKGTVDHVDDKGNIHVRWDTGSSLALIFGMDVFSIVVEGEAMKDTVPYKYPWEYACEQNEQKQYRDSLKANIACKEAIEEAISNFYQNNHLDGEAVVKQLLKSFSLERIVYVLANTVQQKDWDMRFSFENKRWAKSIPIPQEGEKGQYNINCRFVVGKVHPGLTDLLVTRFRKLHALNKQAT